MFVQVKFLLNYNFFIYDLKGVVGRGEIESPLSDFQSDVRTSYTTDPYLKSISYSPKSKVIRTYSNFNSIVSQDSYSRFSHFS